MRTAPLVFLLFFGWANAQFGSLYRLLSEDADSPLSARFSMSTDGWEDDEPTPKSISRVRNRESSNDSLERRERIVGDLGHIVSQTENLFSRLLGVIGGQHGGEQAGRVSDSEGERRERPVRPTSDREAASEGGPGRIFDLFDSIGSLPFIASRISGKHICVREIQTDLPALANNGSRVHKECLRFGQAQKCVERRESGRGGRETARIEECCPGWESADIFSRGCDREVNIRPLQDRLSEMNNSATDLFAESDLAKFSDAKGPYTFIIPMQNSVEGSESETLPLSRFALSGAAKDYDWTDGEQVKTIDDSILYINHEQKFGKITTRVNCVRLVRPNVPLPNGLLHFSERPVRPASVSLLELLENDGRFSTFLSLLGPELRERLSSAEHHLTVLPFSDRTFDSLSESVRQQIKAKSGCVKDLARQHIFRSSACLHTLSDRILVSLSGRIENAQETVATDGSSLVRVGGARVVDGDLVAGNGVVHVVDDVIGAQELLTWRDHLPTVHAPLFSLLKDIPMDEPLTVLVPPLNQTNGTIGTTADAMAYVVRNRTLRLSESGEIETGNGHKVFFGRPSHSVSPISVRVSMGHSDQPRTRIGCNDIVGEPIKACNSVIYFLDKPLHTSALSLEQFLSSRPDLSKYFELLKKSSVYPVINTSAPLTVFVPSNDAFSNNELKSLFRNNAKLDRFVKRYIIKEPLCSADLAHNPAEIKLEMYQNLAGEPLSAVGEEGDILIEGARIQEQEVVLANAVVHVLETTMQKTVGRNAPPPASRLATNLLNIFGN